MNAIRKARLQQQLNLSTAATVLGTNVGNLSRIERGLQAPSPKLALRICQVYRISLDDIYRPPVELAAHNRRATDRPEDHAA